MVIPSSLPSGVMGPCLRRDDGAMMDYGLAHLTHASNRQIRSSTLQLIPGARTARMLRASRSRGALHEAFLKRSGMRRLRVVPRKHASGRPGSPSGPTMRLCHVMAGRGWDEGGEIRRMASHWLASQPGSTVPAPKIAASGAPQGDTPSAFARGGRRTDYRCALRRTAPLIVEG